MSRFRGGFPERMESKEARVAVRGLFSMRTPNSPQSRLLSTFKDEAFFYLLALRGAGVVNFFFPPKKRFYSISR